MKERKKLAFCNKSELNWFHSKRGEHPPTSTRAVPWNQMPSASRVHWGWERVAVWMQAAFDRWGSQASCSRCSKADERMHLCIKCTSRHVYARYIFMCMYFLALLLSTCTAQLGSVQIQSGRHLAGVLRRGFSRLHNWIRWETSTDWAWAACILIGKKGY